MTQTSSALATLSCRLSHAMGFRTEDSMAFDFAPLIPAGSPPPAVRWTGLAKYHFIGGNNDPDEIPVDDLIAAASVFPQARRAQSRDL